MQSNIQRTIVNQAIKFGKLIEYMRNIFLEKSYTKCVRETIARPFSKNSNFWIKGKSIIIFLLTEINFEVQQKWH